MKQTELYKNCLRKEILSEDLTRPAPEVVRDESLMWLDKNENMDEELHNILRDIYQSLDHKALYTYPDCDQLYRKIAAMDNVKPENVLVTAGSDGAIRTVFEAAISPGDIVLHTAPTFAMYFVYCKIFGANEISMDYTPSENGPVLPVGDILETIESKNVKLFCLPNPDSPTGTVLSQESLINILDVALRRNTLVLIDEAYFPFYSESMVPFIDKYPNLIVTRTFAKAWGVAGLRIGYAVANEVLSKMLHKVRPMYEVNTVSVRFLEKLIDNYDAVLASVKTLNEGKEYFLSRMSELGFRVLKTEGNFLHVSFGEHEQKIHSALENIVLYRKNFDRVPSLKGFTRFTSTSKAKFEKIITIIENVVKQ